MSGAARYFWAVMAGSIPLIFLGCQSHAARRSITDARAAASEQSPGKESIQLGKSSTDDSSCSVSVKLLSVSPGKPPQKIYRVELNLVSRRPDPFWLLLSYDKPLAQSGQFRNGGPNEKQPFSSLLYTKKASAKSGQVITVDFLGNDTFKALRVPKGAEISFDSFVFYSYSLEGVSNLEVWDVDSLLVNGKTPLEKWLPYQVLSDQLVHLGNRENVTSLDWDKKTNNYRQDYPDEKVDFVTAHALKKCLIPLRP